VRDDGFVYDVVQHGPILGAVFRFLTERYKVFPLQFSTRRRAGVWCGGMSFVIAGSVEGRLWGKESGQEGQDWVRLGPSLRRAECLLTDISH
jgi:hypothetical protein